MSNVSLIVGAGIVSAFQVGKASVALAAVQADFALDLATASWLLSAFAIVGAVAGIAIGVSVDHAGARRMAVGGLLLQGLCSGAGAFADGAMPLLATRVLEGVGFLAVTVAAPALILAATSPRERGRALAAWGTFMPVGLTLVMLGAPLLDALGWRGFWLANAVLLVGYAALLARGTRSIPPGAVPQRGIADDVRETLTAGGPWILGSLFATFAAAFFAVFAFLPSILAGWLAVSPETAGVLTAVVVAASALGNLACGRLLARGVRPVFILLASFGVMAPCGIGILGDILPGAAAYALCIVFSAVGGLIPVTLIEAASRHAPRPDLVGATVGFLMQGNNVGMVLGPALAGAIAAVSGWPAVALLVVSLGVVGGLLALALGALPAERVVGFRDLDLNRG